MKTIDKIIGVATAAAGLYLLFNYSKPASAASPSIPKYTCSGSPNYQCIQSPTGTTLPECQASCTVPQLLYRCTGAPNYQCVQDSTGTLTQSECEDICIAPSVLNEINIIPSSKTLAPLETAILTITCKDQYNFGISCPVVTWTSDDNLVASVDQTGLVTAHISGNTTIRASFGTIAGQCSITVSAVTPILNSISIPTTKTVLKGSSQTLSANCFDQNGNVMVCPQLAWYTNTPAIATVNSTGTNTASVNGVAVGIAQVWATGG